MSIVPNARWTRSGSWPARATTDPVVRACEVPAGKSLFFPLINNFYGAFLNDPPETRTEEFVRAAGSCTEPAEISVEIDGFKVPQPTRFFTGASGSQSPFFNVQLPPGNLLGADETTMPELVLSPSAEQGYYLFVRPLRPGTHTIRWTASGCYPKWLPGHHVSSHGGRRRPEALNAPSDPYEWSLSRTHALPGAVTVFLFFSGYLRQMVQQGCAAALERLAMRQAASYGVRSCQPRERRRSHLHAKARTAA